MPDRIDFFEVLDDPAGWPDVLRSLRDYWDAKRAGRLFPDRADLDPIDMPGHLPDVVLVEIHDGGEDFTYRIVGTRVAQTMGFDRTGQTASEAYAGAPALGGTLGRVVKRLCETRAPFALRAELVWVDRDHLTLEASVLPLGNGAEAVSHALVECRFRPTGAAPPPPAPPAA